MCSDRGKAHRKAKRQKKYLDKHGQKSIVLLVGGCSGVSGGPPGQVSGDLSGGCRAGCRTSGGLRRLGGAPDVWDGPPTSGGAPGRRGTSGGGSPGAENVLKNSQKFFHAFKGSIICNEAVRLVNPWPRKLTLPGRLEDGSRAVRLARHASQQPWLALGGLAAARCLAGSSTGPCSGLGSKLLVSPVISPIVVSSMIPYI